MFRGEDMSVEAESYDVESRMSTYSDSVATSTMPNNKSSNNNSNNNNNNGGTQLVSSPSDAGGGYACGLDWGGDICYRRQPSQAAPRGIEDSLPQSRATTFSSQATSAYYSGGGGHADDGSLERATIAPAPSGAGFSLGDATPIRANGVDGKRGGRWRWLRGKKKANGDEDQQQQRELDETRSVEEFANEPQVEKLSLAQQLERSQSPEMIPVSKLAGMGRHTPSPSNPLTVEGEGWDDEAGPVTSSSLAPSSRGSILSTKLGWLTRRRLLFSRKSQQQTQLGARILNDEARKISTTSSESGDEEASTTARPAARSFDDESTGKQAFTNDRDGSVDTAMPPRFQAALAKSIPHERVVTWPVSETAQDHENEVETMMYNESEVGEIEYPLDEWHRSIDSSKEKSRRWGVLLLCLFLAGAIVAFILGPLRRGDDEEARAAQIVQETPAPTLRPTALPTMAPSLAPSMAPVVLPFAAQENYRIIFVVPDKKELDSTQIGLLEDLLASYTEDYAPESVTFDALTTTTSCSVEGQSLENCRGRDPKCTFRTVDPSIYRNTVDFSCTWKSVMAPHVRTLPGRFVDFIALSVDEVAADLANLNLPVLRVLPVHVASTTAPTFAPL